MPAAEPAASSRSTHGAPLRSRLACVGLVVGALGVKATFVASALAGPPPGVTPPPNGVWVDSGPQKFLFGVEAQWPDPNAPGQFLRQVDNQHVDLDVELTPGRQLVTGIGADEMTPNPLPASSAYLYANPTTKLTMPGDSSFAFIGAAPGEDVWVMPQGQFDGMIYLGFASNSSSADGMTPWNPGDPRGGANATNAWFEISLLSVKGQNGASAPGQFSVWQTEAAGGATVLFATSDGISSADKVHLLGPGHSHYNWGFTAPGLYEVELNFGTFVQVPEPGGLAAVALAAVGLLCRRRTQGISRPPWRTRKAGR